MPRSLTRFRYTVAHLFNNLNETFPTTDSDTRGIDTINSGWTTPAG